MIIIPDVPERVMRNLSFPRLPKEKRISITNLIGEPLPQILLREHWDECAVYASDFIQAFIGTAVHKQIELSTPDDERTEEKFVDVVDGIEVVGVSDNYKDTVISDPKTCKTYAGTYKSNFLSWGRQLNCYALQRRVRGFEVTQLKIDAYYKDWSITQLGRKSNYPKKPFEEFVLPLWTLEDQWTFIKQQLELHIMSPNGECSIEGKWQRFEVRKKDRQSCLFSADTRHEAESYMKLYESEHPKVKPWVGLSEPLKCKYFCNARSVCPYAKGIHNVKKKG